MSFNHSKFQEKFSETIKAVFPILAIVLVLCFTITPVPPSILVTFLIGAVLLILGMLLFNVGVETSMTPIGERVGSIMTRSKNVIIMDAARAAGAYGGTIIHAKGTAGEMANKFMGVTIADEKEIVYIVSKSDEKNAIMKAIMEKAGLNSKAKAICFSLPVSDTAGLRLLED